MRPTLLLGSVLLPAVLLTTGCAGNVTPVGGPAAPVTAAPVPSATSAAPSTAPSPSLTSAAPDPKPTRTKPALVLGPFGLGSLKLGMSRAQASASGLIGSWTNQDSDTCTKGARLRAARSAEDGVVLWSTSMGVAVIDAYPGVSTPEGIRMGSTKAAMLKAYPDWESVGDPDPKSDGRGAAAVPGNGRAYYRISTENGKVTELTLQYRNQDCYE